MNYEQKYKEAMEVAKLNPEKRVGDILGDLFPECVESEDEMIRKELMEFL